MLNGVMLRTVGVLLAAMLVSGCGARKAIDASNVQNYSQTVGNLPTADVQISARNGESLRRSLATANAPLSLAQRESFMSDFFGYNEVSHCLDEAREPRGVLGRTRPEQPCFQRLRWADRLATPYLTDERMDKSYAGTATSLIAGSRNFGHRRGKSFALYVGTYGKYFDGLTVAQIQENAVHYKKIAADPSRNQEQFTRDAVKNLTLGIVQ